MLAQSVQAVVDLIGVEVEVFAFDFVEDGGVQELFADDFAWDYGHRQLLSQCCGDCLRPGKTAFNVADAHHCRRLHLIGVLRRIRWCDVDWLRTVRIVW